MSWQTFPLQVWSFGQSAFELQLFPQAVTRQRSAVQLAPFVHAVSSQRLLLQVWSFGHSAVVVHVDPQTLGIGEGLTLGLGEGETLGVGEGLTLGLGDGFTAIVIGETQLAVNVPDVTFAVLVIVIA